MLTLTRFTGEAILIGQYRIEVHKNTGRRVELKLDVPRDVRIQRGEHADRIREARHVRAG